MKGIKSSCIGKKNKAYDFFLELKSRRNVYNIVGLSTSVFVGIW